MSPAQKLALAHVALLAEETAHPRFGRRAPLGTIVLTVNAGYECLDNDFGGPVWHASARALNEPTGWAMAERALMDVGDARLGEWREAGGAGTVHLRRRLTDEERAGAGGLGVRDVRGTDEEKRRLRALLRDAPHLRGLVT